MFSTYDYSVMVGTVYIEGVLFAFLALTIMDYSPLPSWSAGYLNLEYMIYGFGDHVALHCTTLHGIWSMSRTYSCDRTGTTLFIGHNDAALYLVGYEGRTSYASICIHHWFGIKVQLHTLMGMKAGVHVH